MLFQTSKVNIFATFINQHVEMYCVVCNVMYYFCAVAISMSDTLQTFLEKAELKAFDAEHKRKLLFNIGKYNATVVQGKNQYSDLEYVRKKAKNIKWKVMENLDK